MDETAGKAPVHEYPDNEASIWSEILPGLWLGGTDDWDTIEEGMTRTELQNGQREIHIDEFQTVVTAYAWAKPVDWLVEELRYCYYDADDIEHIDKETLLRTAKFAYDAWKSGRKTLIRCQAGLNRSGLIMAIVLLMDGYTAEDAIHLMRTQRCRWVLCNRTFVGFAQALEIELVVASD
jgi:hypothetical protein